MTKWVELPLAKMVGTDVIDIVTKMSGAHCGKNGWNWCFRHLDKNGWSSLWQKWIELTVSKMGEAHLGKNGLSYGWQKCVLLVI